jgi:tRNA pseudouridine32 synthase/23S rRNA pseudouridine746 synthase
MDQPLQLNLSLSQGDRPIDVITEASGLSISVLEDAAQKGAVWISRARKAEKTDAKTQTATRPVRLRNLHQPVSRSGAVMLNYNAQILAQSPKTLALVADHHNYGIWNKPKGMLCQGSKWSDHTTAVRVAESIVAKRCHLVHRLDKAASGLLIVAYTANATRQLSRLFALKQIRKQYQVSVEGEFDLPLPHTISMPLDEKSACTEIVEAKWNAALNCTDLNVMIKTGRKHQIRRHLSLLGHPVVGDRLYSSVVDSKKDLQLHACTLSFSCPFTNKPVNVSLS